VAVAATPPAEGADPDQGREEDAERGGTGVTAGRDVHRHFDLAHLEAVELGTHEHTERALHVLGGAGAQRCVPQLAERFRHRVPDGPDLVLLEIVLAGLRGDRSLRDLCREHGISETLYSQWRDKLP
jgi:hypothetical protein